MRTVTAEMEYEGKCYLYEMEWDDEQKYRDNGDYLYESEEAFRDAVWYMWTEGNYSCDCNRALFICDSCDDETYPSFCEGDEDYEFYFPCGKTIKLVDLRIDGEPFPADWWNDEPAVEILPSGIIVMRRPL